MSNPENCPKVLIAPLDWGLGHATRCVPIIKTLIELNCKIYIAADGATASLLKKEFKEQNFIYLKGYYINYSQKKEELVLSILRQIPKILGRIYNENRWLKKAIKTYSLDAVISDNRFGLFTKKIPCVYLTHQLAIQTGHILTNAIAQKIHYYFIKKYTQCWVPDALENGIAGKLSHPQKVPANVKYIGLLSRFEKLTFSEWVYDLCISISGPEPQRSIFEQLVLSQIKDFNGKVLIARGLPSSDEIMVPPNHQVTIVNHLLAHQLNTAIEQSKLFISRSGYTTIMDLIKLKKNAVLVPTPGQTEQEYLAKYLMEKKYFYTIDQADFSLKDILEEVSNFSFKKLDYSCDNYKNVINEFVGSLKSSNFASQ
jgi:uncharacterized protein (TIGR00661 family)